MRFLFSLFFIALQTLCIVAQDQHRVDSLQSILKSSTEDTNQVNTLKELAWEYMLIGQYDLSHSNAGKSLKLAEKLNYKKGINAGNYTIGVIYQYQNNYPKALEYSFNVLKDDEESGIVINIISTLNNIGYIYDQVGDFPKALKYLYRALELSQNINSPETPAVMNDIAILYRRIGDYEKALEMYNKALQIETDRKNNEKMAAILNNIAVCFLSKINMLKRSNIILKH